MEAAVNIGDSLRYTLCIDDTDYVRVTGATLNALKAMGYTIHKFKNYWANDSNSYQGINTQIKTPDGNLVFELQFHTHDSFDAKDTRSHKYYEIVRSESSTQAEKDEAQRKIEEIFKTVPVPAGVRELKF